MFDTSHIGKSFPPFVVEVYGNKISELTTAIGDNNPVYHSREAAQAEGLRDIPISPTTPTLFTHWGARQRGEGLASLGINVKAILHGEEEYEYLSPIYPGDSLTGVTTIIGGKVRKGSDGSSMDIITTQTSYTNQHNQPVLNARTTIVVREKAPAGSKEDG